MFKKLASIALAALMVTGTAAIASAAETEEAVGAADQSAVAAADESEVGASADSETGADSKIYFEAPSFWNNYKDIRLYLYEVGGDVLIPWNSKKGKMTDEKNGKWSFDMSKFPMSDSKTYACIFLTNTEAQTCDLFIGNPCLGDTAYCTGENNKIENTEDSNKKSWEVKWRTADPNRWGVPLAITSIGNIVGYALPAGQSKYDLFLTFLKDTGKKGVNNAIKFNHKSVQQTIDDAAKILELGKEDVKKALAECGQKYDWDESKSSLNEGSNAAANQKSGGGSSSNNSSSNSSSSNSGSNTTGGNTSGGGTTGGGSTGGGSTGGGSTSAGGSTGSGSVTSGQETTIFFVFGGIMLAAAGVIFLARKRREF